MLLIGTFEQSLELELALAAVETAGVSQKRIAAVSMDTNHDPQAASENRKTDGIELGVACATATSVVGASFGFALAWGPVLCGLGAAILGFAAGYLFKYVQSRSGSGIRRLRRPWPEVTVFVECGEEEASSVQEIFRKFGALSVGNLKR